LLKETIECPSPSVYFAVFVHMPPVIVVHPGLDAHSRQEEEEEAKAEGQRGWGNPVLSK
jgi:hypothetical protein